MKLNLLKRPRIITSLFGSIPVFYACDDNYVNYMMVSITSLIEHASPENKYTIHILYTSVSEENRGKVLALATDNVNIQFDDVTERLEKLKSKLHVRDYYSSTTYYRFFIPDMFPAIDKAIYIDGDTVILSDIAGLYSYNLGSNLVAAVQDMLVKNTAVYGNYAENVLNISQAAYFNAGMVMINCALFRKNNYFSQFINLLNAYTFVVAQDQDYLNILFQDKILWVNSKWNVQMTEEFIRKPEDIAIIHYNLAQKPWHYEEGRYFDYFWQYAAKTAVYGELKKNLADFSESDRKRDDQYGRNLLNLANEEISNEQNYHKLMIPDVHRQTTRQEIVERIKQFELEGRFDEDVEDDPPGRTLMPDEIDYLHRDLNARIRTRYAFSIARWFMNTMISKRQLIIKDIVGIENYRRLQSGAVITCNHFNAMDTFAMQIAYEKSRQKLKGRKLFRVIKEGNYTSFPGFYGFLMRNCNTLPLSSNPTTMKKFLFAVKRLLQKGQFVLVYAEQSMWWNYRKPKPLKSGAFNFAAEAGVPVLPCFVTMTDSDVPGEGGFPVQEYTIHIATPIYPQSGKSKAANIKYMMEENERVWKQIYEEFYGIPLTYTTAKKQCNI